MQWVWTMDPWLFLSITADPVKLFLNHIKNAFPRNEILTLLYPQRMPGDKMQKQNV